jgi:hypothetical protein
MEPLAPVARVKSLFAVDDRVIAFAVASRILLVLNLKSAVMWVKTKSATIVTFTPSTSLSCLDG